MRTPNYELEREDTRVEALIGGRFRLVSVLGEGGMGTVYRARDRGQNFVALKVMKPELETSPTARRRLLRECELLQRIESPHVVQVYDAGVAPAGELYLAMELLDGEPLGDLVSEGPMESFTQIAEVGEKIALGVAAAHALGVVHRDLKPDNVFLTKHGELRVLDFGIARLVEPPHLDRGTGKLTSTGAILGTPAYISPEGVAGETVTAAADLYSLGVLLFELITGRVPFEAELPIVMMTLHLTEPAPDVREFRPETPERLATLVALLLEKAPADRPSSALAVARELAQCGALGEGTTEEIAPAQETLPIELRRVRIEPPRRAKRSRALPAALGALAGLVLLGLSAAVWVALGDVDPPTDFGAQVAPPEDVPPEDVLPESVPPESVLPENVPPENVSPENVSPENVPAVSSEAPNVEAPNNRSGRAEVPHPTTGRRAPPGPPARVEGAAPTPTEPPEPEPEAPASPRPGQLLEYGL